MGHTFRQCLARSRVRRSNGSDCTWPNLTSWQCRMAYICLHGKPSACVGSHVMPRLQRSLHTASYAGSPSAIAMRPSTAMRPVVNAPRVAVRASVDQQDSDMKAAEARWDAQLRDGIVKNVMSKDLKSYCEDGWTILDVRPPSETRKVHVTDAVEVPLFVPDTSLDPSSLLKQMSAFGLGGWWLGGTHMKPNDSFMSEVQAKIPKDAKIIVACQKGLRSLAAAEQLSRAGYMDLAWMNGGLDNSTPGDVPTRDDKDVRYAGIGGVSEMVGWTEVQQENAGPAGSLKSVFIAVGLILVLDGLVFAYEQYQYMQGKTPFQ